MVAVVVQSVVVAEEAMAREKSLLAVYWEAASFVERPVAAAVHWKFCMHSLVLVAALFAPSPIVPWQC
jgi:hypothetical protein